MHAYQQINGFHRPAQRSDRTKIKLPLDRRHIHAPTPPPSADSSGYLSSKASTCRARERYRRNVPPASGPFIGAAVLVHGLWGNPHDWRWVRGLLEDANVQVITPDLPSHRTPTAGLAEDADEVRHAIRASDPPVAAVGWSYGGSVISLATAGEESVSRLIYISDIHDPRDFPAKISAGSMPIRTFSSTLTGNSCWTTTCG
jgi:pimeloyl-ACP methyl ester carboxylesterase